MSADLQWFAWYPKDWMTSTARLAMSHEQRSIYFDLLNASWLIEPPCTLPDDDAALARIVGVSLARWRAIGPLVRRQFEVVDGGLRHAKLYEIWLDSQEQHERRVRAGSAGGKAKAAGQQSSSNATSNATSPAGSRNASNALATTDTVHSASTKHPPPPRARGALGDSLSDPVLDALGADLTEQFCDWLRAADVRVNAFTAEAAAALAGMHGPPITGAELRTAVTDYLANNAPPNLRLFRRYLAGAKPLPPRAGANGAAPLKPSVVVPDYGEGTQEMPEWKR